MLTQLLAALSQAANPVVHDMMIEVIGCVGAVVHDMVSGLRGLL